MKDDENRISFIKVEITDGKADTKDWMLSNETEKCSRVESLRWFGSDGASVITGHEKVTPKFKRDNPKRISMHCDNHRLALAIFPFFNESIFLTKNNNYLIC